MPDTTTLRLLKRHGSSFSNRLLGTRCVMSRVVLLLLAVSLAFIPAGIASAQLEAPEGLLFAEIPAEVKSLIEQLYVSPEPASQVEAANKLAAMGEGAAPAVPYLVQILSERIDATVRDAVVTTLEKIGKSDPKPIIEALKSDRTQTRLTAIKILEVLADKQAVEPLVNAVLRDSAQTVRDQALQVLAKMAADDPSVSDKLIATVEDEKAKPVIRSRAMKALGHISGAGLNLDSLVAMLGNEEADIRLRCAAAAALGRSGNAEAVGPLLEAFKSKKAPIRLWAAVALNGQSGSDVITALTNALKDEDDRVRVRAADALAAVQDPKVIDPLTKALADENAEVRTWGVIGLGNFSDKKAFDALTSALADSDVAVRVAAADALGRTGSLEATSQLNGLLNDFAEGTEVRVAAARAIGSLRDSRAVPSLLGLVDDPNPKLRQWVVSALGRIGDARAVEPLIGALADDDPAVRGWAALALSRFRDPRIIAPLTKALEDPDAKVRGRAVLALRVASASPQVKAALEKAANDPDPEVQRKAKQVLGANG